MSVRRGTARRAPGIAWSSSATSDGCMPTERMAAANGVDSPSSWSIVTRRATRSNDNTLTPSTAESASRNSFSSVATLEQLAQLLPDLVPARLDDLVGAGLVEVCGPQRYCVPSPSLLQLAIDMAAAGYEPDQAVRLLTVIASATASIADAAVDLLEAAPSRVGDDGRAALTGRGRGLLAHGVGRLTVHAVGRRLGITDEAEISASTSPRRRRR